MKGREALVKNLQIEGVEYIFGYPLLFSIRLYSLDSCSSLLCGPSEGLAVFTRGFRFGVLVRAMTNSFL